MHLNLLSKLGSLHAAARTGCREHTIATECWAMRTRVALCEVVVVHSDQRSQWDGVAQEQPDARNCTHSW